MGNTKRRKTKWACLLENIAGGLAVALMLAGAFYAFFYEYL